MRKILDIQTVIMKHRNLEFKTKRVIWTCVDSETSRSYKTDTIGCTYVGAGFHHSARFFTGKSVNISKKDPMKSVSKIYAVKRLEDAAKRGILREYLCKKHSGEQVGKVLCDAKGDRAGMILVESLGITYHYYNINCKGEIKRDDLVKVILDKDSGLFETCGLHSVEAISA